MPDKRLITETPEDVTDFIILHSRESKKELAKQVHESARDIESMVQTMDEERQRTLNTQLTKVSEEVQNVLTIVDHAHAKRRSGGIYFVVAHAKRRSGGIYFVAHAKRRSGGNIFFFLTTSLKIHESYYY